MKACLELSAFVLEELAAERVVIATDGYPSGLLGELEGLIVPTRGQVIATDLSPDALSGLEANYRFPGPETIETKIFGRLSAWQNWIFQRPNAAGPDGALRRFGTGQRADFDRKRV